MMKGMAMFKNFIKQDGWFILGVAFVIWTLLMQIPTEIPA